MEIVVDITSQILEVSFNTDQLFNSNSQDGGDKSVWPYNVVKLTKIRHSVMYKNKLSKDFNFYRTIKLLSWLFTKKKGTHFY